MHEREKISTGPNARPINETIAGTAPWAFNLRTAARPVPVRRVAESFTCLAMMSSCYCAPLSILKSEETDSSL